MDIPKMLKETVLNILNDPDTKIDDVDYSGFTEDPNSKPTTMIITCDISERT